MFAVGGQGVVEFLLPLQLRCQVLVRTLVEGIDFDLLPKSADSVVMLVEAGIGSSQIIPRIFLTRILVGRALQQIGGGAEIPALQGRGSALRNSSGVLPDFAAAAKAAADAGVMLALSICWTSLLVAFSNDS